MDVSNRSVPVVLQGYCEQLLQMARQDHAWHVRHHENLSRIANIVNRMIDVCNQHYSNTNTSRSGSGAAFVSPIVLLTPPKEDVHSNYDSYPEHRTTSEQERSAQSLHERIMRSSAKGGILQDEAIHRDLLAISDMSSPYQLQIGSFVQLFPLFILWLREGVHTQRRAAFSLLYNGFRILPVASFIQREGDSSKSRAVRARVRELLATLQNLDEEPDLMSAADINSAALQGLCRHLYEGVIQRDVAL